jgi:hypothetical protein
MGRRLSSRRTESSHGAMVGSTARRAPILRLPIAATLAWAACFAPLARAPARSAEPALAAEASTHEAAGSPGGSFEPPGYLLAASDGGVFALGGSRFFGSAAPWPLNAPVTGIAATPDGGGYWLVAADGGVFAFGDARFFGSVPGLPAVERPPRSVPFVAIARDADGKGYLLVNAAGDVYSFGDAPFYGSLGATVLAAPVTGIATTPDRRGYWLVGADGGVFSFGDARFFGSAAGPRSTVLVTAIAATPDGSGYWLATANGGVFAFGNAPYGGSTGGWLRGPVIGMAEAPGSTDPPASTRYPSGSTGYDVSNYQCGGLPPQPYTIAIVEVRGAPDVPNPCLDAQAAWAGWERQFYVFLAAPQGYNENGDASGPYGVCPPTALACQAENFGYRTSQLAVGDALARGWRSSTWWLDVESVGPCLPGFPVASFGWSCDQALDALVVEGALRGLEDLGLTAGVYSNPHEWAQVLGSFAPELPGVPEWVANWNHASAPWEVCSSAYAFAGGPVWLVQYTDDAGGFDGDYAC